MSGQPTDLGFPGCNVREKTQLELRVRKRHVTIYINRQEVYAGSYPAGSRLITGLGVMSNGLCEFGGIELKGADGTVVYAPENAHSL